MKYTLPIIVGLLLWFTNNTYAQENFNLELGRVTQFEMDMTSYDKDPEAEALVISHYGEYYFSYDYNSGFELIMENNVKIKILKQAGVDYADFDIVFYDGSRGWENVYEIKGITYNYENGLLRKTELEKNSIFEKKHRDDVKSKTFTLPDVKEGSIVELSYKIRTPYYARMREWKFQRKIPTINSELVYNAIPFYAYSYILTGTNKFDHYNSEVLSTTHRIGPTEYKEVAYTFGMKNVPAFRDEEFLTSENDYILRLNMQLSEIQFPGQVKKTYMSTWPEICDELLKDSNFGKYINASEKEGKKVLPTLNIEGKTDLEKVKILSDHVKMMYNWNNYYGKYTNIDKLSNFLKQKSGNVANLNLYLIGLLRAANIEAHPVMISTREHGAISKNYPFLSFFNYVLAVVNINDEEHFIDATESLLAYNELPSRCINVTGLIVKPKKTESWTFIAQNELATTTKEFNIKIDTKKGVLNNEVKYTAYGNDAFSLRKQYLKDKLDLAPYLKKIYNIDTEDGVRVENYMDRDKEFIASFEFKQPVEATSDKLFIKPFSELSITENPFKKNSRILPIDLIFIEGAKYKSIIEIPKGYKVEFLPKAAHPKTQIMTINYEAKIEGNKIIVNGGYEMRKNIFPANDYHKLKSMYAAAIQKFSEMIVLVKE